MNPQHDHLDELLDEALEETFPASDPPAVSASDDPPRSALKARQPTSPRATHARDGEGSGE